MKPCGSDFYESRNLHREIKENSKKSKIEGQNSQDHDQRAAWRVLDRSAYMPYRRLQIHINADYIGANERFLSRNELPFSDSLLKMLADYGSVEHQPI